MIAVCGACGGVLPADRVRMTSTGAYMWANVETSACAACGYREIEQRIQPVI